MTTLINDSVNSIEKAQAIEKLKAAFPDTKNSIIAPDTATLKSSDSTDIETLLSSENISESEKESLSSALLPPDNSLESSKVLPKFNIIYGTPNPDLIIGTSYNDIILAGGGDDIVTGGIGFFTHRFDGNDIILGQNGNDLFIGGTGNDIFLGGSGNDTADYSFLNKKITLKATGIVDKGIFGQDQLYNTEVIKGGANLGNTIDGTVTGGNSSGVSLNVNLDTDSLIVNNIPFIGTQSFTVENFDNAIGTDNNDNITGNNNKNVLTGGKGNDVIDGKGGNDILTGVSPTSASFVGPGVNEIDTLTGGSGKDVFVVGDSSNVYYEGLSLFGNTDYAQIQDFQSGVDDIQLNGGISDYVFSGNSFIFLDDGFSVGTLDSGDDLIATVGGTGFTKTDLVFV